MAFHVEIRRSLQRARAFNIDGATLRRTVLEPWGRGEPVRLGDQDWDPAKCTLAVLEGPDLVAPDLAHGRGWDRAQRTARDVTARLLGGPNSAPAGAASAVAVLAASPAGARATAELLVGLGLDPVDWPVARAWLLGAGPDGAAVAAAVILVEGAAPHGPWFFEAGIAVGALGGRAIFVAQGAQPAPDELPDLQVIRLDPDRPDSLHALAERLSRAGCAVGPVPG